LRKLTPLLFLVAFSLMLGLGHGSLDREPPITAKDAAYDEVVFVMLMMVVAPQATMPVSETNVTRIEAPATLGPMSEPVQLVGYEVLKTDGRQLEPTIPDMLASEPDQAERVAEQQKGQAAELPDETTSQNRPRYVLTDAERDLVERVVMGESRDEGHLGHVAVAQCILNACETDGIRPGEVITRYKYCKTRPNPSAEVIRAVAAVFDDGETATDELIKYFYAPARTKSAWHESLSFVMEIGGHRFFAEWQN